MAKLRLVFQKAASLSGYIVMNLITLPYYRFFRQNTLLPILAIAETAKLSTSNVQLAMMLSRWRDRKLHELYFVQVAGTLLSAAVIGCFSWEIRDVEHWIGPAARYCSLVLSLFAILLSASQSFIFTALAQRTERSGSEPGSYNPTRYIDMICYISKKDGPSLRRVAAMRAHTSLPLTELEDRGDDDREKGKGPRLERNMSPSSPVDRTDENIEVDIRWNMVFTWQAPMMLLAYSVVAFLVGLTVYVCTPLYIEGYEGKEAAIFYLASLGVGGLCFVVCSSGAHFGHTSL